MIGELLKLSILCYNYYTDFLYENYFLILHTLHNSNFHLIVSYECSECDNYDNIYLLFKDFLVINTETLKYSIDWNKLFYALNERNKINYNDISIKLSKSYWYYIKPFNNLGDIYIYKPLPEIQNFYLTPEDLNILNLKKMILI